MYYTGQDGKIHSIGDDNYLQHWKYIKKIRTPSGWRYFYTMAEVNAFNKEKKDHKSIQSIIGKGAYNAGDTGLDASEKAYKNKVNSKKGKSSSFIEKHFKKPYREALLKRHSKKIQKRRNDLLVGYYGTIANSSNENTGITFGSERNSKKTEVTNRPRSRKKYVTKKRPRSREKYVTR